MLPLTLPDLLAAAEPAMPLEACPICSGIPGSCSLVQKSGETYDDLPAGVRQLRPLISAISGYKSSVDQCPTCHRLYECESGYEYLVDGSEDSTTYTRIEDVEAFFHSDWFTRVRVDDHELVGKVLEAAFPHRQRAVEKIAPRTFFRRHCVVQVALDYRQKRVWIALPDDRAEVTILSGDRDALGRVARDDPPSDLDARTTEYEKFADEVTFELPSETASPRPRVPATPAGVDAADIARALELGTDREALADSSEPLATFLRRAGAFFRATYEEIDFTDWNGAVVGRGDGAMLRAAIGPDPSLPFVELEPLLEMGRFARELVARHPSTPPSVLLELAVAEELDVQDAVLSRGDLTPEVLERLRASKFQAIRSRLGIPEPKPPPPTHEQFLAWASVPDPSRRFGLTRAPNLPEDVMEKLASDPDTNVRMGIAARADLTPSALARLLEHGEHGLAPKIVKALCENPVTSESALAYLARAPLDYTPPRVPNRYLTEPWPTTRSEVRALIAHRRPLPHALAITFAGDSDSTVRKAIAANPSIEPAILERFLDDRDYLVRTALAGNPAFKQLDLLATDPSPDVSVVLAAREDATGEVLALLAKDASSAVRKKVAARKDTPVAVLEALSRDAQTSVRIEAERTLTALGRLPPARRE
ncbi:MAG: hypothetical protein JST00_31550 [Deltaproteobacteria bacterium]|nr:hypothetical protein [Deltaproteobacteria bacterium]